MAKSVRPVAALRSEATGVRSAPRRLARNSAQTREKQARVHEKSLRRSVSVHGAVTCGEVGPKSRTYARNCTNFSGLVGPRKRQFGLRGQLADGCLPRPDVGEEAVGVHGESRPPP